MKNIINDILLENLGFPKVGEAMDFFVNNQKKEMVVVRTDFQLQSLILKCKQDGKFYISEMDYEDYFKIIPRGYDSVQDAENYFAELGESTYAETCEIDEKIVHEMTIANLIDSANTMEEVMVTIEGEECNWLLERAINHPAVQGWLNSKGRYDLEEEAENSETPKLLIRAINEHINTCGSFYW